MFTQKKESKAKEKPKTELITDLLSLNLNNLTPITPPSMNLPMTKPEDKKTTKKDFAFIIPKAHKSTSIEPPSLTSPQIPSNPSAKPAQPSIIKSTEAIPNNTQLQHSNTQDKTLIYHNFIKQEPPIIEQSPTPVIPLSSLVPPLASNPNDPPQIKFKNETKQINLFLFNQLEDFKLLVHKINQIKAEVQLDREAREVISQMISELTNKQNELIETNNFDEAIKVEEEIKENKNKIKVIDYSIQMQTETNLNKLNLEIIDLFNTVTTHLNSQVDNISLLLDETITERDSLNLTEKKKLDELSSKIEQKTKDTKKLHIVLQSSIRQVKNEEKFFFKQIEQEAGQLLTIKEELNSQKSVIEKQIEELTKQLEAANASLYLIEEKIALNDDELDQIKSKYEMDESYKLALISKETSQSIYDDALSELNQLNENYSAQSDVFNKKIEEISSIIKEIDAYKTIKQPKYFQIKSSIGTMREIIEKEKENYNKKHISENKIEVYSNKVVENKEKIEEIELQNKRIQSDILSLESNLSNLEDVKKAHVAKKQFKDAQAVNIEIKKYIENKKVLSEVFNENIEEVAMIKKENDNLNQELEGIKNEIEEIAKEINKKSFDYAEMYLDILTYFIDELSKESKGDNAVIEEEIKSIKAKINAKIKVEEAAISQKDIVENIKEETQQSNEDKEGKNKKEAAVEINNEESIPQAHDNEGEEKNVETNEINKEEDQSNSEACDNTICGKENKGQDNDPKSNEEEQYNVNDEKKNESENLNWEISENNKEEVEKDIPNKEEEEV